VSVWFGFVNRSSTRLRRIGRLRPCWANCPNCTSWRSVRRIIRVWMNWRLTAMSSNWTWTATQSPTWTSLTLPTSKPALSTQVTRNCNSSLLVVHHWSPLPFGMSRNWETILSLVRSLLLTPFPFPFPFPPLTPPYTSCWPFTINTSAGQRLSEFAAFSCVWFGPASGPTRPLGRQHRQTHLLLLQWRPRMLSHLIS